MKRWLWVFPTVLLALPPVGSGMEVKVLKNAIVNDKIVDAVSPGGLAVTRDGDYLATFSDHGDVSPGCRSYLVRSRDQGTTWEEPEQVFGPNNEREGVTVVLHNLPDGEIMLGTERFTHDGVDRKAVFRARTSQLELFRMDENGKFVPLQKLNTPAGAAFTFTGSVVELPNGDWVLPAYGYPKTGTVPGALYGSGFFRSRDRGASWGDFELAFRDEPPAGEAAYDFNESGFFVKPDGTLVALARIDSRKVNKLWRTESTDNGKTWSKPVETAIGGIYPVVMPLEGGGYLLACGNREARPIPRSVNFFYSADGDIRKGGVVRACRHLWAMGKFSLFVRPGYKSIETAGA